MIKKILTVIAGTRGRPALQLSRHVAFFDNGKGATFYLHRSGAKHEWRWQYDAGLSDDLTTAVATQMVITELEEELGLPHTFPKPEPTRSSPAPPSTEILEARAGKGDHHALEALWNRTGEPVTDHNDLIVGRYYSIGYDLGIYRGDYLGVRMKGTEFEDDREDNEHGHWLDFEAAETLEELFGKGGNRVSPTELSGEKTRSGDMFFPVRELPVPQEEAKALYDRKREEHVNSRE